MASDFWFRLRCDNCGVEVAQLDEFEYLDWLDGRFAPVLCFDCDEFENVAMRVDVYVGDENPISAIGPDNWCFAGTDSVPHARAHERTHERTRARISSSYTKLNRTLKNRVVFGDAKEYKTCPNCFGEGFYNDGFIGQGCSVCDTMGIVESAVFLPRWILGLESGNE